MKISIKQLKRYYHNLPVEAHKLRDMFDEVGLEVKRFVQTEEDIVLTLELLANRGDHLSYWGVAQELSGRFGGAVVWPESEELSRGKSKITLRCESDLCLRYTAIVLEVDDLKKSLTPSELFPLGVADIHSIDAAVDATNLINLELGQPTHLFDADKIVGSITIRLSKSEETAHLLFQEERVILPVNTLVIADDQKILAIAGVIGCEDSKITSATRRMVLESATFDPVSVRKTSRAMKVSTDSSARFERGADPEMAIKAAERVVFLLEKNGVAHSVGPLDCVGSWDPLAALIQVDPKRVQAYFQTDRFSAQEITERLTRYGFEVKSIGSKQPGILQVTVPSYRRWEVRSVEDIYEELARSVGYDNLPQRLPFVDKGSVPSKKERIKSRINELLVGNGFYEIFTNGFYGRHVVEQLEISDDHPLQHHIEVINAIDKGYSLLKNSCLPQALEAVAENLRFKTKDLKMFEWSRKFVPDIKADNKLCREQDTLWMLVNGEEGANVWNGAKRSLDVWYLKGIVEEFGRMLGLPFCVTVNEVRVLSESDFLHPHRQAMIMLQDEIVGLLGEVHPKVCENFDIKRNRPCYLEWNVAALLQASDFVAPEKFDLPFQQPMQRMLAFTLPHRVQAQAVVDCIKKIAPEWLEQISITDLYQHEENNQPVRTLTFSLQYNNEERDHTVEDVNQVTESLIAQVVDKLGSLGVKLRQ